MGGLILLLLQLGYILQQSIVFGRRDCGPGLLVRPGRGVLARLNKGRETLLVMF